MILGKIIGKLTTIKFIFQAESSAKKFQYCQVFHKDYDYVLCQIVEIEKDIDKTIAKCNVIGYMEDNKIAQPRTPFEPGTEVLEAENDLIKAVINIPTKESAYIGKLEGKDIGIHLDLNQLLTKHIAILAKSGSGKSYTSGVLAEEIIEKKIPLLIIDPHGEYSLLKQPSPAKEQLAQHNLAPKQYNIMEYSNYDDSKNQIILNNKLSIEELIHLMPTKLSNSQISLLYSIADKSSYDELLLRLQASDNPAKHSLIPILAQFNKINLFSESFTPYNEIIQSRPSIINLRGISPDIQEIIVYKLLNDLFEQRKKNQVPPFFCIIEEAHNFCPERSFGEAKSSKILRTIASEGRKFGLGLCIVSQRPARVDKNVLSQCSTQIILRITNPNDLKAVCNCVEGLTYESENEITNLPVGTAMLTGIVDLPLFIQIRPRRTRHGGDAPILVEQGSMIEDTKKFADKNLLPIITPKFSISDLILSAQNKIKKITTYLIPIILFKCFNDQTEFTLLVDQIKGEIIINIEKSESITIDSIDKPQSYASYEKIEYRETQYDIKLDKKITLDELKTKLSKLLQIKSQQEGFVVYHHVETGNN